MAIKYGQTGRRLLAGAAFLTAALSWMPPATAGTLTLDFDDLDYSFLGVGDSFAYHGLQLTALSGLPDAETGDLAGGIFDGQGSAMCIALQCPVDNNSHGYYAGLNDGVLLLEGGKGGLQVQSFDASFIGAFPRAREIHYYPDVAGLLEVRGFKADGSFVAERFQLAGTGPAGADFTMQHFETSAGFASQSFTELAFFAYSCNFVGDCVAFETNAGQFALDNLNLQVSAVPEPSSWLMLLGGLGTLGFVRRRRAH